MKKKLFTFLFACVAMMSYQVIAQDVKTSFLQGFETDQPLDEYCRPGFDYPITTDIVENPNKDGVNRTDYVLEVERPDAAIGSSGPWIKIGDDAGLLIDPMKPETWFLHISCNLPDGVAPGAGIFAIHAQASVWAEGDVNRFIYGNEDPTSERSGQIYYPQNYEAGQWIEFDYDLRKYLGTTLYKIQVQGERNGSMSWFIDNICVDNRQKDFANYEFGTSVPIVTSPAAVYVFKTGTKSCIAAQAAPAVGKAKAALQPYKSTNSSLRWTATPTGEKHPQGYDLFTLSGRTGDYLYNDATIFGEAAANNTHKWFVAKKLFTEYPKQFNEVRKEAPLLYNAGTWKFIKPKFLLNDIEINASNDSTSWTIVKQADVPAYLATVTSEVESQVANGDYFIFYAGTNYCLTDPRLMGWKKVNGGADSCWINADRYSISLEEYNPVKVAQQKWQIRDYTQDVDAGFNHRYFDAYVDYKFTTRRWVWVNGTKDSITRSPGARVIMSKPYDLKCIDTRFAKGSDNDPDVIAGTGDTIIVKNFRSLWGDNATMIPTMNDMAWFVKQVPVNKDGLSAIYRPNNGYQGSYMRAKYAGGALYASHNDNAGSIAETQQYCWMFIKDTDPRVATAEAAKALINPDTIFGMPATVPDGEYYIAYRGTAAALTMATRDDAASGMHPIVGEKYDAANPNQIWTVKQVVNPIKGYENITGQFTLSCGDKYLYASSNGGVTAYCYTLEDAEARGNSEGDSYFKAVSLDPAKSPVISAVYGADQPYILYSNDLSRRFLKMDGPVLGMDISGYTETGIVNYKGATYSEYPFVFKKVGEAFPAITKHLAAELDPLPARGFYYLQYAYANDKEDLTKTYVLGTTAAPANNDPTTLQPYDAAKDSVQQWYLSFANAEKADNGEISNKYYINAAVPIKAEGLDKVREDSINQKIKASTTVWMIDDWNSLRVSADGGGTKDGWWSFSFYEKEGKIIMREPHDQFIVDACGDDNGESAATFPGASLIGNYAARPNNWGMSHGAAGWESPRSNVWYIVPATDEPAFKPVSKLAFWHPDYTDGIENGENKPEFPAAAYAIDGGIVIEDAEGATISVTTIAGSHVQTIANAATKEAVKATPGAYTVTVNGISMIVIVTK